VSEAGVVAKLGTLHGLVLEGTRDEVFPYVLLVIFDPLDLLNGLLLPPDLLEALLESDLVCLSLVELGELCVFLFDLLELLLLEVALLVDELLHLVEVPLLVLVDLFEVDGFEHLLPLGEVLLLLSEQLQLFFLVFLLLPLGEGLLSPVLLHELLDGLLAFGLQIFGALVLVREFIMRFDFSDPLPLFFLLHLLSLQPLLIQPLAVLLCDLLEDSLPRVLLLVLDFEELLVLLFDFLDGLLAEDGGLQLLLGAAGTETLLLVPLLLFFELVVIFAQLQKTLAELLHSSVQILHLLLFGDGEELLTLVLVDLVWVVRRKSFGTRLLLLGLFVLQE
jgi:hypothetical protein